MTALNRRSMLLGVALAASMPRVAMGQAPSTVNIPLEIREGRVFLDVSLNGEQARPFILDTGGVVSLIRRDVAQAAALQQVGSLGLGTVGGYGGTDPREGYLAEQILIGGIARQKAVVFAGVAPQQIGFSASGSLDGEVLTSYNCLLSFAEMRWTVFLDGFPDRTGFTHISSDIRQPAKRGSPFLYVDAELDGKPVRLLVDTGAPRSIILQSNAAKRLGFLEDGRPWAPWRVRPGVVPGAIGREIRADRFDIGGQAFAKPIVSLRSNAPVVDLADGLLGLGIIQRLDWIIDRKSASLWVKRNDRRLPPQHYNRSGLLPIPEADGAIGVEVGTDSPAERAGIKAGDRIVGMPLSAIEQSLLGQAGKIVVLDVERGGISRRVTFALQDFL